MVRAMGNAVCNDAAVVRRVPSVDVIASTEWTPHSNQCVADLVGWVAWLILPPS